MIAQSSAAAVRPERLASCVSLTYHVAMHDARRAAISRPRCGGAVVRAGVLVAGLLGLLLLLVVSREPLLAAAGAFLMVESPLEPAAAIVVLGGGLPYREMEAAALYQAGWADRVLLVPVEQHEAERALRAIGVVIPTEDQRRRETLARLGVPADALRVAPRAADSTFEELCIAAQALAGETRPVILVSSPYHLRRVLLAWQHVTGGRLPGLTRAASQEPFDPAHWWQSRRSSLAVVREYLGLFNWWAGFPVRERSTDAPAQGSC
jgi:uncharacterized SAM-binding protein YcdF (DUF218 family)